LDSKTKNFSYVNAGHNFPVHLLKDGEFRQLETGALVVGIAPDRAYNEGQVHLSPGGIIVIYSDGVTEAEDASERLFGEQRLQKIIKKNKNLSSQKIMAEIFNEVKSFQGGTEQDDDITLVVMKAT
ncbi:serine/threonine-protein phosphatase, partial [candidate division KSB1 bacterium]|nr:serine/threonine-protein phosphatase [candidate division KSB1 bacterium]